MAMQPDEGTFSDNYCHPEHLSLFYTPTNVPGAGIDPDIFEERLAKGCDCQDICSSSSCSCAQSIGGCFSYTSDKRLDDLASCLPIFECHEKCKCDSKKCPNRVVQLGPRPDLGIGETASASKGKGLFCSSPVFKGQFVCEYAGEVIGAQEAKSRLADQETRKKDNYIIVINEFFQAQSQKNQTIVDPAVIGNIGRYLNHSCSPNLIMHPVRYDSFLVPHLALFAAKDIPPLAELCFDYSGLSEQSNDALLNVPKPSLTPCHCQSDNCKGFLPFSPSCL